MRHIGAVLKTLLAVYAIVTAVFIISENRRQQSTMAWMLAFVFAPGVGVLLYFLFGRDGKAFSKHRELLMKDLGALRSRCCPPCCPVRMRRSRAWSATA